MVLKTQEDQHREGFLDDDSEGTPGKPKKRLHHLDWLRLLMVAGVVYAHTTKSGINGGGGFNEAWLVDDATLFDHADYAALYDHINDTAGVEGPVSGQCVPTDGNTPAKLPPRTTGRSPLAVRWISIARQWCLPLLFWVSGAAVACSYRGGMPRGLPKLAAFTVVGMGFNACLWFLGPLDDRCIIGNHDCDDKGLVFSFTIVPWAGMAFAILFQMWYTVVLMAFSLLNWPLFSVAYGSAAESWVLCLQWLLNMALYAAFVLMAGETCPERWLVLGSLAVLEASFLALVAFTAPDFEGLARPRWLPLRAVHYLLAVVSVLQFGAIPFAEQMRSIGYAYIAYLVTGFNRFFNMGFLMTTPQLQPDGDTAEPLLSRVWPLAMVLVVGVAPSTNWDLAGMLTYPFFTRVSDRCLYVAGAMVLTFLLDRCSRGLQCAALPGYLGNMSLILYLCHPVFITVLLCAGMSSVHLIWLSCVSIALVFALVIEAPALIEQAKASGGQAEE